MSSYTLDVQQQGSVARITFGHPASNAMSSELLARLAKAIEDLSSTSSVIVLQSEGERVFCAGANFDELLALETQDQATAFFSGFAKVILAIRNSTALVLGRIQAKAVGGGVGIIAACDYALALDQASIKLSEIGIGIAPLVIEPAVTRKIGAGAMASFALHPKEWKTAEWALNHNLYQSVFQTISHLDHAIDALSEELSAYSPKALAALKASLWEGTSHWESLLADRAEASGRLALTAEAQEIISAFKNKG